MTTPILCWKHSKKTCCLWSPPSTFFLSSCRWHVIVLFSLIPSYNSLCSLICFQWRANILISISSNKRQTAKRHRREGSKTCLRCLLWWQQSWNNSLLITLIYRKLMSNYFENWLIVSVTFWAKMPKHSLVSAS